MPRAMHDRVGIVSLSCFLIVAGCSTPGHEMHGFGGPRVDMPEEEVGEAPMPKAAPVRRKVTIAQHAQGFRTAQLCESAARDMRRRKPKKGWALLRACARRYDFTEIDRVLNAPWIDDIRKNRKSGAKLVSQIVANRGGNVELDLGICNQAGVQLFGLKDAMANARVFRGRYVLMRGKVLKINAGSDASRLTLAETTLSAENIKEKMRYGRYSKIRKELSKGRSEGGIRDDIATGRGKMTVASRVVSHETNRQVIGWMNDQDPEMKEGAEFLFLVRFDQRARTKPTEIGMDDIEMGTGAIVGHFTPLDG